MGGYVCVLQQRGGPGEVVCELAEGEGAMAGAPMMGPHGFKLQGARDKVDGRKVKGERQGK